MSSKPKVLVTSAPPPASAQSMPTVSPSGATISSSSGAMQPKPKTGDRDRCEAETRETDVARDKVEALRADLANAADLSAVEAKLRDDAAIEILVNNAGVASWGGFLDLKPQAASEMIAVNVTALTLLSAAVAPRFAAAGRGAIVNIASVVGVAPEFGMTVYGATKAFVLYLSQGLQHEFGAKGVYVQAVLPAATRTDIWSKGGVDVETPCPA